MLEQHMKMKMPPGWYAISEVSSLSIKKPNLLRRFGVDLAIWRTSKGSWIANLDRCPHRSASLSLGSIKDDCIVCPFHGFAFTHEGSCSFVPEIGGKAPGLRVEKFEVVEKNGLLWLPLGQPETEIPWFSEINDSFTVSKSQKIWNTHFTRCVENQLDYAHLPFVHKKTIGAGFNPKIKARVEVSSHGLKTLLGESGEGPAYFELRFPNIWTLYISERMREFLAFVPIDDTHTLILMRHYDSFTSIPILRHLFGLLNRPFSNYVLSEDQGVVISQSPQNSLEADSETLLKSDTTIRAFRSWMNSSVKPAL